eukprot:257186-Rhodomonas_salina.1
MLECKPNLVVRVHPAKTHLAVLCWLLALSSARGFFLPSDGAITMKNAESFRGSVRMQSMRSYTHGLKSSTSQSEYAPLFLSPCAFAFPFPVLKSGETCAFRGWLQNIVSLSPRETRSGPPPLLTSCVSSRIYASFYRGAIALQGAARDFTDKEEAFGAGDEDSTEEDEDFSEEDEDFGEEEEEPELIPISSLELRVLEEGEVEGLDAAGLSSSLLAALSFSDNMLPFMDGMLQTFMEAALPLMAIIALLMEAALTVYNGGRRADPLAARRRGSVPLSSYALAAQCPVLMNALLSGAWYFDTHVAKQAVSGIDAAAHTRSLCPTRCPVLTTPSLHYRPTQSPVLTRRMVVPGGDRSGASCLTRA